jgi:hypothetical protein
MPIVDAAVSRCEVQATTLGRRHPGIRNSSVASLAMGFLDAARHDTVTKVPCNTTNEMLFNH